MFNGICQFNTEVLPKASGGGGDGKKEEIIDYNVACGLAMSRLHLSVFEFYQTTPIEFFYALKQQKEWDEIYLKTVTRTIYESMRIQTTLIHNMSPYSKKAIKKPTSLLKFEWDEKEQPKVQSLEEMKQALHGLAKKYGNKKKGKK